MSNEVDCVMKDAEGRLVGPQSVGQWAFSPQVVDGCICTESETIKLTPAFDEDNLPTAWVSGLAIYYLCESIDSLSLSSSFPSEILFTINEEDYGLWLSIVCDYEAFIEGDSITGLLSFAEIQSSLAIELSFTDTVYAQPVTISAGLYPNPISIGDSVNFYVSSPSSTSLIVRFADGRNDTLLQELSLPAGAHTFPVLVDFDDPGVFGLEFEVGVAVIVGNLCVDRQN